MIIESDDETAPSPKGAVDESTVYDDDGPFSEQQSLAETGLELGVEIPAVEVHEEQGTDETPMPPVQDLSLVLPETKPNPFTACKNFLCSPPTSPPLVRTTVTPDVGCLSFRPPAFRDAHGEWSTITSQVGRQESPTRKAYIFSSAEIRTLVASRGSDEGAGPNKLVFSLDWKFINGIVKWRNFKAGQG